MNNLLSCEDIVDKLVRDIVSISYNLDKKHKIKYGWQISISKNSYKAVIRVFESKKSGIKIDLSLIDEKCKKLLFPIIKNYPCKNNLGQIILNDTENEDNSNSAQSIIGTDESGKGDYFGPLVIAGVCVEKDQEKRLKEIGVCDSKKLSDKNCIEIAKEIKSLTYSVVIISPEKYNILYSKIKNLNKLLAWGHARVIENILLENTKINCKYIIADQFGNENLIKSNLMKKGKSIKLIQKHRAEEHISVASASILARVKFIEHINKMSNEFKIKIPKGANKKVIQKGKELVKKYNPQILLKTAKYHFKTTKTII